MKLFILTSYEYPDTNIEGLFFKESNADAKRAELVAKADTDQTDIHYFVIPIITKDWRNIKTWYTNLTMKNGLTLLDWIIITVIVSGMITMGALAVNSALHIDTTSLVTKYMPSGERVGP
jgi:hypothetical protein